MSFSPDDTIMFQGEEITLGKLCEEHNVPWVTARNRKQRSLWPTIRACTEPVGKTKPKPIPWRSKFNRGQE